MTPHASRHPRPPHRPADAPPKRVADCYGGRDRAEAGRGLAVDLVAAAMLAAAAILGALPG